MDKQKKMTLTINDFSLKETLECGQCFRFQKIDEFTYTVIARQRLIHLRQATHDSVIFYTSQKDFDTIWKDYFDLSRDYRAIKKEISEHDSMMQTAIQYATGLRLLQQEFFECLISFILSQNNHIPRIKRIIETLSKTYGTPLDENSYAFPTLQQMSSVTEDELRQLGTGFRAKYITDAIRKLSDNTIDPTAFSQMDTAKLRETLMKIHGVGPKVADCVMLFSLKRYEVFPIDVWVKRIMIDLYCHGCDKSLKEIQALAKEMFGKNAGFAQQYLFYYARQNKIGK